jgi:PIN domain nuclease of toxin-antitoxin system
MVDGKLAQPATDALNDSWRLGIPTFVSPITAWELGLMAFRGRFKSPDPPLRWFERVLALPNFQLAELPPKVLVEASFLPGKIPRDPADRIIAATVREFGYILVTRDGELRQYAKDGYINVVVC